MKRIIALILVFMLLLISCGDSVENIPTNNPSEIETTVPSPEHPDDIEQPEDDHEHSYTSVVTSPTCNTDGYTTYSCTECDDEYVADVVVATGHGYIETVVLPTCTSGGYTAYVCSECNFSYVDNKSDATGHSYKATVTTPTCENHGYTTYVCSACNDSYVENNFNSTGHGYTTVTTAPTCDKEGYTTYTCSSCNESYIADKVAALGHNYNSTTVSPTCENDGYTVYNCSTCNDSYISNTASATGHSYTTVVTAPTCNSEGYSTHTCSVCTYSYVSDKASATGHNCNKTVTLPTCEDMGYTTYICITCSHTYISDQVAALGHNWKDATTSAPKTCSTCGATEGDKLTSTYETLYVNFINVGQGDSIFIKVGDCDILIDAGTSSYGTTVSNYLKNQGVDDIELMINTHPDSDHCGGLTKVLNNYVVEEVWISKFTNKSTNDYSNFKTAINNEGLTAKKPNAGTVYTYKYLTLTVLYSAIGSDSNNSSIVVMLEYGSFRFLFTGDIGSGVESQLVSSGADLSCDVLKVGHHGSAGSSSSSFLNATGADYGVICVGSNSYGHPTSQALNNLSSAGIDIYTTMDNGDVVFSTNGSTLYLPGGGSVSDGSGTSSGGSSSGGTSSGGSSSGSSSGSTSSSDIFIGNTESKVFHLPTCSNLPAASKQNVMYNYWWIINIAGYTPCGRCLKDYTSGSTVTYIANPTSKVYHVSTCNYLPSSSNRVYITSTAGYTPCGHCIK